MPGLLHGDCALERNQPFTLLFYLQSMANAVVQFYTLGQGVRRLGLCFQDGSHL